VCGAIANTSLGCCGNSPSNFQPVIFNSESPSHPVNLLPPCGGLFGSSVIELLITYTPVVESDINVACNEHLKVR
jgi:hypothetical protein